ncbi:MAG: hypothetical protein ACI9TY_000584 [Alphaproteobacteria bacterium]
MGNIKFIVWSSILIIYAGLSQFFYLGEGVVGHYVRVLTIHGDYKKWVADVGQVRADLTDKGDVSFIVLDLDLKGIELIHINETKTYFNLRRSDFSNKTSWPKSGHILFLDRNNDGKANDTGELFSTSKDSTAAYLKGLDTNRDLVINKLDAQWNNLKLWHDKNLNAKVDKSELFLLNEKNIKEIKLKNVPENIESNTSVISAIGTVIGKGKNYMYINVWPDFDLTNTQYVAKYNMSWDVLKLPTLRGYGHLPDLHISLSKNPKLRSTVTLLVADAEKKRCCS